MNPMNRKTILTIVIVLAVVLGGAVILSRPDQRSPGQKIGDAIDALPQGLDKAGRQLEDRTPAEKLQDAAKDASTDAKKAINQP